MSKHKPTKASKRARSPKITARAQRNKQDVVRSLEENVLRSAATGATALPRKFQDDSKQMASLVENRVGALQDDLSQKMRISDSTKGISFSLATANMQAYQAKLLEIAQANMQFSLEFGQRLATIRSPIEFFSVIAEFTSRRIDMVAKHSLAAHPFWGTEVSQVLTARPGR